MGYETNHSLEGKSGAGLAAAITWNSSKQFYYTVRLLADREKKADAFRAYAYFRWVDDTLDSSTLDAGQRAAFMARQQRLFAELRRGQMVDDLTPEEALLAQMLAIPAAQRGGLDAYLDHMMLVMAFDTRRRGEWISEDQLEQYTYHLAAAVTEALQYFIGGEPTRTEGGLRYLAASGAHVTHMLRDYFDDLQTGYFNIPSGWLEKHHTLPQNTLSPDFRRWVKARVALAHRQFQAGRMYLAQLRSFRCRLAGYAYIARFEHMLKVIECEDYFLRLDYPERHGLWAAVCMFGSVVLSALHRGQVLSTISTVPQQ